MIAQPISIPTYSETAPISGEAFFAMGDIGACELIDGRIVSVTPPGSEHGMVESNLTVALKMFVRQHRCGRVLTGEAGVYIRRNPDRVRGTDVLFISQARLPGPLPTGFLEVAPDLVVEIVSPHDRWSQLQQKLVDYFSIGVTYVWVVDPKQRAVFVYTSLTTLQRFGDHDTLRGEGVLNGFEMPVSAIFEDDLG